MCHQLEHLVRFSSFARGASKLERLKVNVLHVRVQVFWNVTVYRWVSVN